MDFDSFFEQNNIQMVNLFISIYLYLYLLIYLHCFELS